MPLQSSGAISLNDLQTEFGGSNPIAITEYYRGGGLVPNVTVNNSVPTSGQISLSNFYGASAVDVIPAAFDINNISGNANSNQITITSINTPITLNFGTSNAYASGIDPDPLEIGDELDVTLDLYIYVNGSLANSVQWNSFGGGSSSNITLNAKVTVSNNDTVKAGFGVSGSGGSGGATFNITNDSSSNTSLDTFDVFGNL